MAGTPAHDHPYKHQLPPSPPPSPPSARRRHKKKHDPFEELAKTPLPSRPATPEDESAEEDSLITRIILTPVLFISFLISLCVVNYRNRVRRANAHSHSRTPSVLDILTPSSWLDPEPYQDPDDSTWDRKGVNGHVEPHDSIGPRERTEGKLQTGARKKRGSWHLHKKIRKVTKLEVSDAFEMRGTIIVIMAILMGFSALGMWFGMRWIYALVSGAISGPKA